MTVVRITPERENLFGASAAQADLAPLMAAIAISGPSPVMVEFDFSNAVSVSGSYLRASLLWCALCGEASVKGGSQRTGSDPWEVRPLPLYPVMSNCSSAIIDEAHDLLWHRKRPGIWVTAGNPPEIDRTTLVGMLDPFLVETLRLLTRQGGASAQVLAEISTEVISANAWNNRLIDLLSLRLVTRGREGKTWIYKPIAKAYTLWA